MDLTQRKLNKSEWESIEVPVSQSEQKILKLIIEGFNDVNIKSNDQKSLISFLKIDYNDKMEDYLFNKYFRGIIIDLIKKYSVNYIDISSISSDLKIKSADKIRLEKNNSETINKDEIYEFILINHLEKIIQSKCENFKYIKYAEKYTNEIEKNNKVDRIAPAIPSSSHSLSLTHTHARVQNIFAVCVCVVRSCMREQINSK